MAKEHFETSCPFCKSDSKWISSNGDPRYFVECECGASGPVGDTEQDAINLWESRTKAKEGE